jgi:hypothetical protein
VTITPQLPRKASLALSGAKVLALGMVLLFLVSGLVARTPTRTHDPSALRLDLGTTDLERAMAEHDCTATGFGDRATPRSGLILREGRLEHVSFDRAWSVFTGEQAGELVAVCLSEASVPERAMASGA